MRDGVVVDAGYSGGGLIGSTSVRLGTRTATLEAFALPDIQLTPEILDDSVRYVQTAGGRTGLPAPRRLSHPPHL